MQATDQINDNFDNNCFTLGNFINLSKAFDTVDHQILISKLENHGVEGNNFSWFKSYLKNRNQYLIFSNNVTALAQIKFGVPQRSILRPLLFLIYLNDFCNASNTPAPIIFAD